ncbi:MAG: serine/threonine-protein kinase, partial [Rhodothermales bacterium]|nr:serine/threonine-protein kinase [Rhodothermales bacterium]
MYTGQNKDRWSEVGRLFDQVADLGPDEQERHLRMHCNDESVISEVLSLLSEDREIVSVLDEVAVDADRLINEFQTAGQQIGPYTIVRRIGEGGMGSVYLADRTDGEFEQQVALKVVRPERSTDDFVRRFREERQILARLQHPNIARLLDGGISQTGQLYFAMEFIDGEPIDDHCDRNRLSIDQRLDLFTTVCRTVHFAHQNLVVHRDLKPENILVDREGRVKLLDFGIAKLLESETEVLQTGGAPMTPEYASPEQIRGQPLNTASDLYSLGVILYELLSGRRPYDFPSRAPGEVARVVLDSKVISPSTVFRSTRDDPKVLERISHARGTAPDRLQRRLAGDLDMICLKALRKEPEMRYESASAFADDVRLHRGGMPVVARPPTLGYRMQKFVRRHRRSIAATCIVVLAAIATVSFYTTQLREERNRAQSAALRAERVSEYLAGLFQLADPTVAQGETVTAR